MASEAARPSAVVGPDSTGVTSLVPKATATGRGSSKVGAVEPNHTVDVGGRQLTFSHGVHDGQIEIGIPWVDTAQAQLAIKAVVGSDATLGDSHAQGAAVVDYINAHGGIAGLKILPIYHRIDVQNSATASGRAQESQSACADWEQDHHAFAFLVVLAPDDNNLACAKNTQTPVVSASAITAQMVDDVQYAQMPNLVYNASNFTADERERLVVGQMVQTGVLTPASKVGLLIDGTTEMAKRAARNTLLPELRRSHITVVSQIEISDCLDAPYSNYVLQMRQAGVTHVYFGAGNCGAAPMLFLGRAADSQRWYPQYIMGSDEAPAGQATQPEATAAGIHGAGWQPFYDVANQVPLTPTDALCGQIMKDAGQPQYDAFNIGASLCEALLLLQAALRNSTAITPDGLAAGTAKLGDTWPPELSRRANFSGGHRYAADTIQPLAYNASCKCIKYLGTPARSR